MCLQVSEGVYVYTFCGIYCTQSGLFSIAGKVSTKWSILHVHVSCNFGLQVT